MKDCKLTIIVKDEKVNIEGSNISMEELATLTGYIQTFIGMEAMKRGMNIEDIKTNLLDVHLAAMQVLDSIKAKEELNGY